MKINLHIKRLVLEGISLNGHQQNDLKAVIETELTRQLVSQGDTFGFQTTHSRQTVSSESISIGNTHKPERLGQQIGNAVCSTLRK